MFKNCHVKFVKCKNLNKIEGSLEVSNDKTFKMVIKIESIDSTFNFENKNSNV